MCLNYAQLSKKYQPTKVTTLLVGEAPPPSGKTYFYLPKSMGLKKSIEKDRSLPATIFNHYFGRRPNNVIEYESFLHKLKENGVFLIDIIDRNLKIRDSSQPKNINLTNLNYLISQIPILRTKLINYNIKINDENIIFLLPRRHYESVIAQNFPDSQIYTWIEFRLNINQL